jgi:hypothetical protein
MEHRKRCSGLAAMIGLAVGAAVMLVAPRAFAGPNTGSVSFSLGMDFTTAYFFRGILQERDGFIWQPYGEINVPLWVDEGGDLDKVTFFIGNWNSVQSKKTLSSGSGPGNWYESDIYGGFKFSLWDTVEFKPFYIAYTYPNGAFNTIQEIDFGVALNDAQWLDTWALNPSALIAWEVDNTALGTQQGSYAEVDIRPAVTVYDDETYPVSLALPMTVGMSVSDYYPSPSGRNQGFGYYKGGLIASVPLGFMPEEYGAWSISAGPSVYVFNSNLKNYNKGNNPWVVGTVSLNFSY